MPGSALRLREFLPYRLSFTSNIVSDMIASRYRSVFGLNVPEWRVLAVVAEQEPITQQEICRITQMDKVAISRATAAVVERQLVAREANPEDRRSHLLRLAPAGRAIYAQVAPSAKSMEARLFACLSAAERKLLFGLLDRVDAHVLEMEAEEAEHVGEAD